VLCLQGPLLRSLAPPAHKEQSVYLPRAYLTRYVPPTPFLTALTAYSASPRSRVLHRVTLMGFLPSRVTPEPRGQLRLRNHRPSWRWLDNNCFEQWLAPRCLAAPPGIHSAGSTVTTYFRFPFRRGPTPSWVFTCGTSAPPLSREINPSFLGRPDGPVTCPDLKRAPTFEKESMGPSKALQDPICAISHESLFTLLIQQLTALLCFTY